MSDVTELQQQASNPHGNVWVSANAGSGKTKVLTDRYLRLLLNHVPPEKILCITYTKAGAAEMKHRIVQNLRKWHSLDDDELKKELASLAIENPDEEMLTFARHLFTGLLDKAHTINIGTIHSFCQSLLGRFPLECETVPHFSLVEGTMKQQLLDIATESVFEMLARQENTNEMNKLLNYIPNNEALDSLIGKLVTERHRLTLFFDKYGKDSNKKIADFLQVNTEEALEDYINQNWTTTDSDQTRPHVSKNPLALQWLDLELADKIKHLQDIRDFFFAKAGTMRKKIEKNAELADLATKIQTIYEYLCRVELYQINTAFLDLSRRIIDLYAGTKHSLGRLDYDDLILKARSLLQESKDRDWVSYKLDGGIDHILLDEAQDTNPEQWDFIKTLVKILFDKASSSDEALKPSLFVVGDEKQSIFRFQRADVNLFNTTRESLTEEAQQVGLNLETKELHTSFRSSKNILAFADNLFGAEAPAHSGMGRDNVIHKNFKDITGRIEIMAPFINDEKDSEDDLAKLLQGKPKSVNDSETKTALAIARKVKNLLASKSLPYEDNRKIQPGDIMILLRRRGSLMYKIIAAMEKLNIPVAGVDRIKLLDNIAVQDLLALAHFCLLPSDDLTLAGFLKSPFIGLDEAEIYELCRDKKPTLWQALQAHKDEKIKNIVQWLERRKRHAHTKSLYDFFALSLSDAIPCHTSDIKNGTQAMASRLGVHVQEILQEFLDYTYSFEESNEQNNSLQEFLYEINHSAGDVKREMGVHDLSEVRIMSIHGAKGLESPIVILPDTVSIQIPPRADNYFDFWYDANDKIDIPFWIPKIDCEFTQNLKAEKKALDDEEYHRLLYVAVTRAKSHLYIYAAKGRNKIADTSWYALLARSIGDNADEIEAPEGEILWSDGEETEAEQTESPKADEDDVLPAWLFEPVDKEEAPSRPIMATGAATGSDEVSARSPLLEAEENKKSPAERGTIIHNLLQYLPQIPEANRQASAMNYLAKHAENYKSEHEAWVKQVLTLMQKPECQRFFSPNARAEVSVSGTIESRPIVARIDLLLMEGDSITIVDYKTSPKPPKDSASTPKAYKRQMQIYKQLLQDIYPKRKIETGIIWTHSAEYMELETNEKDL